MIGCDISFRKTNNAASWREIKYIFYIIDLKLTRFFKAKFILFLLLYHFWKKNRKIWNFKTIHNLDMTFIWTRHSLSLLIVNTDFLIGDVLWKLNFNILILNIFLITILSLFFLKSCSLLRRMLKRILFRKLRCCC